MTGSSPRTKDHLLHGAVLALTDIVDEQTRSRMMAGIRSRNTRPELIVRKGLHARGFRYRLHARGLVGRPDMVFRKYGAVIFVHGCFWHGHDCSLFRLPGTRSDFWQKKIGRNRERDSEVIDFTSGLSAGDA